MNTWPHAEILVFQPTFAQGSRQGRTLGAHALGVEAQSARFPRIDVAPQGDGVFQAVLAGQVPIAETVGLA